eukprot:g7555.t1
MFSGPVRVQPDVKYVAEDLLEIKGVHHKIIDFNRDARQAGSGDSENKECSGAPSAIMGPADGNNNDLILPQVFIDGQFVGNGTDLQGLEDDGLLDNILKRQACMSCGSTRRKPDMTQCPACWAHFEEILPGEMTITEKLQVGLLASRHVSLLNLHRSSRSFRTMSLKMKKRRHWRKT